MRSWRQPYIYLYVRDTIDTKIDNVPKRQGRETDQIGPKQAQSQTIYKLAPAKLLVRELTCEYHRCLLILPARAIAASPTQVSGC